MDAIAQENSFSLLRLITWAMPIVGFLGTVLGITAAISGVTPEALEEGMSGLTSGLSEAFDSTALALALTMLTMFLTSLVEKQEQSILELVDRFVDRCLAHRWKRDVLDQAPVLALVQQSSQAMTAAVESVVNRQAEILADGHGRAGEAGDRGAGAHAATVAARFAAGDGADAEARHAQRLAALEQQAAQGSGQLMQQMAALAAAVRDTGREQQAALVRISETIAGQANVLGKLQEGEANLVHLQAVLHQNLAALAGGGAFEEAVHSLTAAVHMLTTRAGAPALRAAQGKAA